MNLQKKSLDYTLERRHPAGNNKSQQDAGAPVKISSDNQWHSRGYLPHFDSHEVMQHITFRLFDSVPNDVISAWKHELHWTENVKADDARSIELRKRIIEYEDKGHGECRLALPGIAEIVQNAFFHFNKQRYCLVAWCIMPNHVHIMISTLPGYGLSGIVNSWKSFTASAANKLLNRSGRFWAREYFDRYIRNQKHYNAVVAYIHENPVKAGLVERPEAWPYSSAKRFGSVLGAP